MSKPRSGTSYRLSEEAQQLLTHLASRLGLTKTGVLEMAIRKLANAELGETRSEPHLTAALSVQEMSSVLRQAE